jgi:PIN domain nuclease of toxin-antitoxin system
VTVLDAYAVIAYLRAEPYADDVAALPRGVSSLSAADAADVVDQLTRVFGSDPDDVHADQMLHLGSRVACLPRPPRAAVDAGFFTARCFRGNVRKQMLLRV